MLRKQIMINLMQGKLVLQNLNLKEKRFSLGILTSERARARARACVTALMNYLGGSSTPNDWTIQINNLKRFLYLVFLGVQSVD